jgi:PAS domain S-box-containing protein
MDDLQIGVGVDGVSAEVSEDERRFRMLADNSPVMIWRSGLDKRFDYINRHWFEFTGRGLEQEVGLGWTRSLHPDDYQRVVDTFSGAHSVGIPFTADFHLRRSDGDYRWLLCNGVPFYRDDAFAGFLGSCVDISAHEVEGQIVGMEPDQHDAELRQLNHRVKNSLQTSISFSALGRHIGDPGTLEALSQLTDRLSLLALAHEQLNRFKDGSTAGFGEYLKALALAVHSAIGKTNVALSVRCEPVALSPKRATALGTIVDELLTTALTSRFPAERPGTVRVESRPLPDRRIEVSVADDGVSEAIAQPSQASFQRQLVERLTAHANGTIRYELNGGTRCVITLNPD